MLSLTFPGFDQQGYSATQAMDPFIRQFGRWDAEEGEYVLPPVWLSFFNGFNYLGQATGELHLKGSVESLLVDSL